MKNYIETHPLASNSLRQYINAKQAFVALLETEMEAKKFRGSMVWRAMKCHSYLIRTSSTSAQKSLGPSSFLSRTFISCLLV
jgi:hypothetical protein